MSYFREIPNLEYQSFLSDSNGSDRYLLVKNLFKRIKLRDDLQNVFTLFDKYQIVDGARPETVANEIYGSEEYDWIVIISSGITNVRDEWPLSDRQVYDYSLNVYGDQLNNIHHYETTEVKDEDGRLIMPAGKIVDSNFTIPDPDVDGLTKNPVTGITNYEYEVRKNNEKRGIYILKPRYLQNALVDIKKAMIYDRSSQYINNRLIKTENTRKINP